MKLFINSCQIDEINKAKNTGILSGITMNPTMVSLLKTDYVKHLKKICDMVDVPIFAQVTSSKLEDILEEGKALSSIDKKMIIKVNFSEEGIKGMKALKNEGIQVCATAVHSVLEAIIVGEVEVDHIAVFSGPLTEISEIDVNGILSKVVKIYKESNKRTKVMAAGPRNIKQIVEAAVIGVDEMTCSPNLWNKFFSNPYTLNRWNTFITDWKNEYGSRNWITGY